MCDDLCSFSCLVGSYDMSSQNMYGDDTIASSTTSFTADKAEEARTTSNSGYKTSDNAKTEAGQVHYQNKNPPIGPDIVKNDMRGDYDCLQYNSSGDSICKDLSNRTFPFSRNISEYFSHPSFEKYKQEYSKNAFLRQVIASSLGTCVSVLTLNPISVLKLRLQRQDVFAETSVRGAFRTIYRKDGIRGFWAGERLFYFSVLSDFSQLTEGDGASVHNAVFYLCICIFFRELNSIICVLVTLPLFLLHPYLYNPLSTFSQHFSSLFFLLHLGSRIGLLQSLPSSVIYMTIYEKLKTELAQNSSGNFPSLIPGIAGK
jgi:hypothetical protein